MTAENISIILGCLIPIQIIIFTDFKHRMVYDKVTLPIMLAGLINAVHTQKLYDSLLGAFVVTAILLTGAALGGAGGGDIKLSAGLGLWFGFTGILVIMSGALIIGLLWVLVNLTRNKALKQRLKYFFTNLYMRIFYGVKGEIIFEKGSDDKDGLPFGAFLSISTLLYYALTLGVIKC